MRCTEPYRVRLHHDAVPGRARVLHVIGNFFTGGSAQLVVDLVERLGDRFDQQVLVRSLPPSPAYVGIDLIHRERLTARAAAALLTQLRPNLVHVHMLGHQHDEYGQRDWRCNHAVIQAAEERGCPIVENLNIPVEPYILDAVCCYVHVSDYVRERFGRLDAWNTTIYPGSDLAFFARRPERPVADDCVGWSIGCSPTNSTRTRSSRFCGAVRKRPGTRALIVGGGQFLKLYKRRVADAGLQSAFTFTGYVPYAELPALFARMSVFVAPVHTDSFGQVSPFAMGMELPVVGYRVGALPEITGDPSLLVAPGDAEALSTLMVELLDDRRERLRIGARNRERAERLFSTEAMVTQYGIIYDDLRHTRQVVRARSRWNGVQQASALVTSKAAPVVTVLMAVFNGERYLRGAILSVLLQTFRDFEVIVVDDGSSDRSRAIVESFDDPRIRVLCNHSNLGLSRSLNRGLAHARGRTSRAWTRMMCPSCSASSGRCISWSAIPTSSPPDRGTPSSIRTDARSAGGGRRVLTSRCAGCCSSAARPRTAPS